MRYKTYKVAHNIPIFTRYTEGVSFQQWFIVLFLCLGYFSSQAQLDSIHYLPPMHARIDWGPQYLYISTPEKAAFPVTIKDGTGTVITTVQVSNTQPYSYAIGSSNDNYTLIPDGNLHKPLRNKGLIIEAPKKFYAYYRAHSTSQSQACDLTLKGRSGLGKTFRIGHLLQEVDGTQFRSNFIGIMATEDATEVTFSGFDPNTDFRKNSTDVPSSGPEKVTLQKGETIVFAQYLGAAASIQPPNGFMGGLLESNKPIAVNVGSWCGAPVSSADKDAGIDQIVSLENVGKEYILCQGNGSDALERPIIVAHYNNTQIWINGSTTPIATLNAGQFYVATTSQYTAAGNMHIKASQPVYMYQMIGGANSGGNQYRTAGLIFVPPISCSIPNFIDNITEPNSIGVMNFNGGLMITAMKDSQVVVRVNGSPVNLGAAGAVQGNPSFVTYRALGIFNTNTKLSSLSVQAEGAVQVAMYGQNAAASYAAFYSGFDKTRKEPSIKISRVGDGICPDTLIAQGLFDGVQWVYEDSILKYGKDTFLVVYAPGNYIATGYLGVCRQSEIANDTIKNINFVSPDFPYTTNQPSCYGFKDGQVNFGTPYGGLPPYLYSVDNGATFSRNKTVGGLSAGTYKLVVRDSLGCYNRPIEIKIGEPPVLTVDIVPTTAFPEVVKIGQTVGLKGVPNRKIATAFWQPFSPLEGCTNCLTYKIAPTETTVVTLSVVDSLGCRAIDTVTLRVQPHVFAPNVLYPKSENGNNRFILYSKEALPIHKLAIFNRWGEKVFDAQNITTNTREQGWDATFRGKQCEEAVYIFFAEVEVLPGKNIIIQGDITIVY